MKIMITGPQGAGKTTQAKLISKELGFCLIKTGDLVREFAQGESEKAVEVKKALVKDGSLVDDQIVGELVKKALSQIDCERNYVIDGYPRRMSQLQYFDPEYDIVFFIEIEDKEAVDRLLKRGREDDTKELITERLAWYYQETIPVINYYKKKGILKKINGETSIETVHMNLCQSLKDAN